MSQTSPDIFAYTNPAFCALVLRSFIHGYLTVDDRGPEFPLLFIPLPIVLSQDFRETLEHTNKRTGLSSWMQRNVAELVELPDALTTMADCTRSAIRFGCSYDVIQLSPDGRFQIGNGGLKRQPTYLVSDERGACLSRGERLGIWCGQIGSAAAVYNLLLVTI